MNKGMLHAMLDGIVIQSRFCVSGSSIPKLGSSRFREVREYWAAHC